MLRQRFSSWINDKIFYAKDRRNFLATKLRVTGTKTPKHPNPSQPKNLPKKPSHRTRQQKQGRVEPLNEDQQLR
jgi:hypothetical protein